MNKKLLIALQDKCKDFGLSKAAIEDLAKLVSEGVTDESSDEDIAKEADSLARYARLMQAEVTRKAQQVSKSKEPRQEVQTTETETGDDEPEWFKKYRKQTETELAQLKEANQTLVEEKQRADRSTLISQTAKRLGIPDFLMKRVSISDDADVEKELTDYKQELVTNRLMPEQTAGVTSSSEQAAKDDAHNWAQTLPSK